MPSTKLVEARNTLSSKQKTLADILQEAGDDLDMDKIVSIKGSNHDKMDTIRTLNTELKDLNKTATDLAELENLARNIQKEHTLELDPDDPKNGYIQRPVARNEVKSASRWGENEFDPEEYKSLGQLVTEGPCYKWLTEGHGSQKQWIKGKAAMRAALTKTTFATTAGWPPESTRIGRLVEFPVRPIMVIDMIPGGSTDQAAVVYMEETTRDANAAERAENAVYAESAYELTERSVSVRAIGHYVPVTDEQLQDVAGVESYLNLRLADDLNRRLDGQILNGNGVSPNINGLATAVTATRDKGTDSVHDAIYKAMTRVRVTGRAFPNVVVMHPYDFEEIRLAKTSEGVYLWGNPTIAGDSSIWGIQSVITDAQTEDTALTGDTMFTQLFMRTGIDIEVGFIGDDFKNGRKSIRAGMRATMVTYRPSAFMEINGV